jgi:hypothetical protein
MLKENSSLYNLTNRIVRKINNLTSGQVVGGAAQKSDIPLHTYTNLGAYLAGLIEANGTIGVHDKNSKSKKYRPKIIVVFSLADKPLAEKLATITQAGKVLGKPNAGHVL